MKKLITICMLLAATTSFAQKPPYAWIAGVWVGDGFGGTGGMV